MAELTDGLARHGLRAAHVLAGLKWRDRPEICESADLVVINGEGALHHDRPAVADVIELAKVRREAGKATVLLNSSWFQNPPERARGMAAFSLVVARESESADNIVKDGGPVPMRVPDLAIAYAVRSGVKYQGGGRVMVSDSTNPMRTKQLLRVAASQGWEYLPVLAYPEVARPGEKSRKIFKRARMARYLGPLAPFLLGTRYHAHALGVAEPQDYLRRLAASGGVVTGRFHTVCFALAMGVPFVAVTSNTPKIEAIIRDAGLDPKKRVVPAGDLRRLENVPAFDEQESKALQEFARRVVVEVDAMWERIATLGGAESR
jgi:hypothetical protein